MLIGVEMCHKAEFVFTLFYSDLNVPSLNVKSALTQIVNKDHQSFTAKLKLVNYDKEKVLCKKHGISGIPQLLIHQNDRLVGRFRGEVTSDEFTAILNNLMKSQLA
ncbi:thioredoxin family protein [bacterium]|nr:thioredoxin family protein [bacterium]